MLLIFKNNNILSDIEWLDLDRHSHLLPNTPETNLWQSL